MANVIGNRPLHIAVGAGHHHLRFREGGGPGNEFETDLNGRVCRAVVDLARRSRGFEVRCYTPDDGLGMHPGFGSDGPREVAEAWHPSWHVDIFHEIHAQGSPDRNERGAFVIYPDGAGLDSDPFPPSDDRDRDVERHGRTMAGILARATNLSVGHGGTGIMSERQTRVGLDGDRLGVFGATSTPAMVSESCRFISEVGCYTNPADRLVMSGVDFPRREAAGILAAYAALATARRGWTFDYSIPDQPAPCRPSKPPAFDVTDKRVNHVLFHAAEGTVTAGPDGVRCRQFADPTACQPRPPFDTGQQFDVHYWVEGEPVDGIVAWWVTPEGSATGDLRGRGRSGGRPSQGNDLPGTERRVRETEYAM